MDYTKNALDYTQILTQLKARGLLFKDEERAVEVLANISISVLQTISAILK